MLIAKHELILSNKSWDDRWWLYHVLLVSCVMIDARLYLSLYLSHKKYGSFKLGLTLPLEEKVHSLVVIENSVRIWLVERYVRQLHWCWGWSLCRLQILQVEDLYKHLSYIVNFRKLKMILWSIMPYLYFENILGFFKFFHGTSSVKLLL